MHDVEFWFYCPRRQHEDNMATIALAARRAGVKMEVVYHRQFRNPQRLGARAIESLLIFSHVDGQFLTTFANSFSISRG